MNRRTDGVDCNCINCRAANVVGKARIPRRRHRHPRVDFRGDVGLSGESARILARMSASWNSSLIMHTFSVRRRNLVGFHDWTEMRLSASRCVDSALFGAGSLPPIRRVRFGGRRRDAIGGGPWRMKMKRAV